MSLDMNVYCREISDEMILLIEKRLNDFDMSVEICPDFSFNEHSGFLLFKFTLRNSKFTSLTHKELLCGFELYIKDFDLKTEIKNLYPKPSFFQTLFGNGKEPRYFESEKIDTLLKDCNKVITFNWGTADTFQFRFVALTSAILTELTNGVCCYPDDNIWYETKGLIEASYKETKDYEDSIRERDLVFQEFKEWM